MRTVALSELMVSRAGSVDPRKFPDEIFELYSIPAFDRGASDLIAGSEIGSTKQVVQPGDVLLSKIVPHIRRSWIVGAHSSHRLIASGEWIAFRHPDVEPRYLRHVFLGNQFHQQFMATVSGVGGSLLRARPAFVAKISIRLPSLAEQRRIAEILDRADALRVKRRKALALLDDLTQSIFLDMFGDPVAKSLGDARMSLTDVIARPLQSGAYFPKGQYVSGGSGVEMVHMSDAFSGIVERGSLRRVACDSKEIDKYKLSHDELLVARRSLNFEGSAKPCLIPPGDEPLIFESSLIRVVPNRKSVSTIYLFHYLSNERVRRAFIYPIVTGATISGISQRNLATVPVLVPSLAMQRKFESRIAAIDALRRRLADHHIVLDRTCTSLQQQAFAGQL